MPKLEIDTECANRITICTLADYRKYLKKELKAHKKGAWMHPEDVVGNMQRIEMLTKILKDFGYVDA